MQHIPGTAGPTGAGAVRDKQASISFTRAKRLRHGDPMAGETPRALGQELIDRPGKGAVLVRHHVARVMNPKASLKSENVNDLVSLLFSSFHIA